jgi:hypothetical protein
MKMNKPTSIRLTDELTAAIEARKHGAYDNTNAAIVEMLDRYTYMLQRSLPALRETLSEKEISLIADSCNGTMFQAWSVPLLYANIEDSISLDGLDEKWGVDGAALLDKIRALDLSTTFALVDAVERFWARVGNGEQVDLADILK